MIIETSGPSRKVNEMDREEKKKIYQKVESLLSRWGKIGYGIHIDADENLLIKKTNGIVTIRAFERLTGIDGDVLSYVNILIDQDYFILIDPENHLVVRKGARLIAKSPIKQLARIDGDVLSYIRKLRDQDYTVFINSENYLIVRKGERLITKNSIEQLFKMDEKLISYVM